jgi:glutathione S-transferase
MPSGREERAAVRQVVARANLTCEKVGQLYREWAWRPAQVRWPAAIERLHGQIDAGLGWLEQQLADAHYVGDAPTHADVMAAITLSFVRFYAEPLELRPRTLLPRLSRLAARLESKEAFLAHPLE